MKKREETTRGGTALVIAVHRQGVVVPPNRGLLQLEGEGAPDSNMCTALVTTMGWWCTGQGVAVPPP